jgi:Zn-dependent M28 family amino/carboxypeptidase
MIRDVLWLLLFAAGACQGRPADIPYDGDQALRWVQHQVAAGARVPNTPAHRSIGDWLERELRQRADSVEVQSFTHVAANGDTLRLRNFIARFRPAEASRVLYVSHWDSRPFADRDPLPANRTRPVPGADDGASSTAMLLGVADQLKRAPPALGVDLLFVDGEDYGDFDTDTDVLLGAKHFAANLPSGYRPLFAVLWDMVGDSDQVFLREQHSREAAPEVVDRVWRAARRMGLRRQFPERDTGYITDDHLPLIRAGIRAINVIDIDYPYWHTTADTPDKISAQSLANVGRLALALLR